MKRSVVRSSAVLFVGGAILGATLTPAFAAGPTPQSLGLTGTGTWSQGTIPDTSCGLGTSCASTAFGNGSSSSLYTSAGFVRGAGAAANRAADYIAHLQTNATSAGMVARTKSYTSTFTAKKRQHKLHLTVLEVIAQGTSPAIVMTRVTGRDLVRKKRGTKGPFAKKVGVAAIDMTSIGPIPTALTKKNSKKLVTAVRQLVMTGATHPLTGSVKQGFGQ